MVKAERLKKSTSVNFDSLTEVSELSKLARRISKLARAIDRIVKKRPRRADDDIQAHTPDRKIRRRASSPKHFRKYSHGRDYHSDETGRQAEDNKLGYLPVICRETQG